MKLIFGFEINYLGLHNVCMLTAAMTKLYVYFSNKISGLELINNQRDETLPRIMYPSYCCNEMHELQQQRHDRNFATILRLVNALQPLLSGKSGKTY